MRRKVLICVALLVPVCLGVYGAYVGMQGAKVDPSVGPRCDQGADLGCRVPVPNNRGPEVADGFRGEVHPLLHRQAQTEVKAYWTCEKVPPRHLLPGMRAELDEVRQLYLSVGAAVPAQVYPERDFSGFLPPDGVNAAGQLWSLDPDRIAVFLQQFHPTVSMHSASAGRRPGPDGAFAILRAVSPTRLDILFRVHAEFDLAPKTCHFPASFVWYTPACFLGRIVVNREAGTVQYFQLGVPTDEVKNIHGTVLTAPDCEHPQGYRVYQFLRAERMELVGGSPQGLEGIRWAEQIDSAKAYDKLAKVFYKFKEIDFMPFDQVLATARARKKPIFAFVALGALDDQSC